ncbi:MAG: GAF domain-containing protein, partial [Anaerolineales bacterium]|nr:GAF domain-containing protein [Anaerolineales bacterium]
MDKEMPKMDAVGLARMVEISRVLNSTTNLDQLLNYIITEAAELTQTEAASILLLDPRTRQLHFKASSNDIPLQMANMPVSLDNSVAGAILLSNQPLIVPDVSQDTRWNKKVDKAIDFQTRSILGVPMRNVDQEPVGVLEALNKLSGGAFSEQDEETLSILADIAGVAVEKARLFEELQQANMELSELDQLKTDFIAIASHELRTPLSVILGYVSFLREEASPTMADQFDSVLQAAVHLRSLIQDMLNLRYVDAGEAALDMETLDIVALVREMQLADDETAVAKSQLVQINLPDTPLMVAADHSMIEVIVDNLLSNAIKFTPQGGEINISLQRQGQEVWFAIQDTGIGIPTDQL